MDTWYFILESVGWVQESFIQLPRAVFSNYGDSSRQKWFSSETKIFSWCLYLVFLSYPTPKLHERTRIELNLRRRLLPERITCPQLAKKFPALTTLYNLSLSWSRSVHSIPTFQFLKIHFNIILPTTHGSSKWSLFLRYSYQNSVCISTVSLMWYIYLSL